MKVTELARTLNTTPDTVRYYTKVRLIMPIKSAGNGYKIYGKQAQQRLKFILSARQLDFSVAEKLKSAINDWQNKPDKTPTGHMICHLIEGDIRDDAQIGVNNE